MSAKENKECDRGYYHSNTAVKLGGNGSVATTMLLHSYEVGLSIALVLQANMLTLGIDCKERQCFFVSPCLRHSASVI